MKERILQIGKGLFIGVMPGLLTALVYYTSPMFIVSKEGRAFALLAAFAISLLVTAGTGVVMILRNKTWVGAGVLFASALLLVSVASYLVG